MTQQKKKRVEDLKSFITDSRRVEDEVLLFATW